MSTLASALDLIIAALNRLRAGYALIGGLAVSVRTEPRFTRDIDLAVAVPDDQAAERLVRALVADGFAIDAAIEQEATSRLATVRLRPPGLGPSVIDLLFASSGIEPEIVDASEPLEILPEVTLPVARIGHLIALKLLARDDDRRPQDLVDLRALAAAATDSDRRLAATACALIATRGYSRTRDLPAALTALLGGTLPPPGP